MQMTNLEVNIGPKATLFKEEVDVIIAIVKEVLEKFSDHVVHNGSFLLYGLKDGESEPQSIIAFDFDNGPAKDLHPYSNKESGTNSREEADKVLKKDLENKHEISSSYISYFYDSPLFLSLKTTHGRFSCACFSGDLSYRTMTFVYCAVTQTIACMCSKDTVLHESCDHIFSLESYEYANLVELRIYIKKIFDKCKLPEIKTWKEWSKKIGGELTMFFE